MKASTLPIPRIRTTTLTMAGLGIVALVLLLGTLDHFGIPAVPASLIVASGVGLDLLLRRMRRQTVFFDTNPDYGNRRKAPDHVVRSSTH